MGRKDYIQCLFPLSWYKPSVIPLSDWSQGLLTSLWAVPELITEETPTPGRPHPTPIGPLLLQENKDVILLQPSLMLPWILGMNHRSRTLKLGTFTPTTWLYISLAHHYRDGPTWLIQRQPIYNIYILTLQNPSAWEQASGYPWSKPALMLLLPMVCWRILLIVLEALLHLQPLVSRQWDHSSH